tara:strand:+ start:1142 stop:1378 length:237 start_codon:yes stop_codon:yes gene_type:complete
MKIKMNLPFKKLLFMFIFNVTLFLVLIIAIQNSSKKSKINLIINETVNLPISFIIGISFISGSITGSLINSYFDDKNI